MSSPAFRRLALAGHSVFRRRRIVEAGFLAAAVFLPVLIAALLAGMLLRFSPVGGWLVPVLSLAGLLAALLAAFRFGRRHHLGYREFLRSLERRLGLRENELLNADGLEEQIPGLSDPLSAGLAELTVGEGRQRLQEVDFEKLAPVVSLRRPVLVGGGSLAAAGILALAFPLAFFSSASRLWNPGSYDLPPELVFHVEPGDATVERGSAVEIRASFPSPQAEPRVLYRTAAGIWRDLGMNPTGSATGNETGRFACAASIPAVFENTEYAVVSGKARSRAYKLQVVEALRATGYRTRLTFPDYTGLTPVQELRSEGNAAALLGSSLELTVFPSRPDARGRLLRNQGGEAIPLESAGQGELVARIPVREPMDYRVELTSSGASGTNGSRWLSESYRLDVIPDRPPTLAQLSPERSLRLPPDMNVQLDVDCLDDFGLTRLDLVYRRNQEAPQRMNLSRWEGTRQARVSHPWSLEGIALTPGDRITYHLELTDNDAVSGPKTTIGPEGEIRFPTLDEMYAGVDEQRDNQVQDTRELLEKQKELSKDLQKVSDEIKQQKNMSWEQQEQVKDLAERQKQVSEQIDQLSQSLSQSLDQMTQANLFTPEMLDKVQQINQLVKDIQSPAFRDYLDKMRQAMDRLDRNAVNDALKNLQVTQQDLERNLDRTLAMLQQLQREEKFDQLVQKAERLQEEQKRLNDQLCGAKTEPETRPKDDASSEEQKKQDSADQKNPSTDKDQAGNNQQKDQQGDQKNQDQQGDQKSKDQQGDQKNQDQQADQKNQDDQAQAGECSNKPMTKEESAQAQAKQDALQKELQDLQKQLSELQKEAEKKWDELNKQLADKKPQEKMSSASQNMQKSGQSMGSQQRKESLRWGRRAEKDMQNLAEGMRQAQAAMQGADMAEVLKKLYGISNRLVSLSEEQESLLNDAPSRSTRDLAISQTQLADGAKKTLDELFDLGRKSRFITPELGRVMGEAVRHINGAGNAFSLGDRSTGMVEGRSSGNAMDETVLDLLNASQQMCNSSCSGSCNNPLARMRSLSGQQEDLNQDMQQMMGQNNGQRLSMQGGTSQDQLMAMAARQEMIRRGLAEVQQSMGTQSNILGRLDDLGKEMEDVVQQMKNRNVDERILRAQERILSRLLTAQRSLRKEGEKEERVSRTGRNPDNMVSPPPVPEGPEAQDALRRAVLRGSQDPVPSDFRRLVETYFRKLGAQP